MEQTPGPGGTSYSLADLKALNEEIAALTRARLPLDGQLRRLGRELPGNSGQLAERVGARIEQGASLSEALAAEKNRLPEVYLAVVEAGERAGRLPAALEALVDSGGRLDQLRRTTGAALAYPMLLVVFAWVVFAAVSLHLFPKFAWFEFPRVGQFAESLQLPQAIALAIMILATLCVLLLALWWWRAGQGAAEDRDTAGFGFWFPWLGQIRKFTSIATFAELLRLLIDQDTPLEEALRIAGRATANSDLRSTARSLAEHIASGETNHLPFSRRFPPLLTLALRNRDNKRLMLNTLAQAESLYRQRAISGAQYAAEYLPVLLVAGVGGLSVAALAAVVFWPYLSMLETLSGPLWN